MTADEILAAAEQRIAQDGYDPGHVLACALEALAESWAEDERQLCPDCGRRRINRGQSACYYCVQRRDLELLHKNNWWRKNGTEWREARKATATAEHAT